MGGDRCLEQTRQRAAGDNEVVNDSEFGRDHAIVRPTAAAARINVRRLRPSPRWQPFIEYFWIVRWECPEPHDQQVIPQPYVHVAAEMQDGVPRLLINPVTREPFIRRLEGVGHVLGAAFRPGGFRSVLGSDVSVLAGRVAPIGDFVGRDDTSAASDILRQEAADTEMVGAFETYLDALDVPADPHAEAFNALMRAAESDKSITSAAQLAARAGVSLRTVERHCTAYLGIGPKWVVQRFRLLDAAAAVHAGTPVDWARLAGELGFSDQAHLTRAFTAIVGTPPARYAREA